MVLHLRRALADDTVEVPDHYEGVPLRRMVWLLGWSAGLIFTIGGVSVMVVAAGTLLEAVAAVCGAFGAIMLVFVVRCRRFETQIGRRWIIIGAGPLNRRFKRDLVGGHRHRQASGWRIFYAEQEFIFTLSIGDAEQIVPTRNPEELSEALDGSTAG